MKNIRNRGGPILFLAYVLIKVYQKLRNKTTSYFCGFGNGFNVANSPRIIGASHMVIGCNFYAGSGLWLEAVEFHGGKAYEPRLKIGDNVSLSEGVHIACCNALEIGNNVLIGSRVLITDHNHGMHSGGVDESMMAPNERKLTSDKVVIESGVWIGDCVCILPGVTVGAGSVIGAMSVVTKSIPPYTLAIGSPAKVIKAYDKNLRQWMPC